MMPNEETLLAENHEYISSLIYFEESEQTLDENLIKEKIQKFDSLSEHIKSIHVLHGQKNLLVVSKNSMDVNRIEASILSLFNSNYSNLKRVNFPLTNSNVTPVLLFCELTDSQLQLFANDKQTSVRLVEAKTGLRSSLSHKNGKIYLTGLLFQFLILNDILNENNKVLVEINQNVNRISESSCESVKINTSEPISTSRNKLPHLEWTALYNESELKGHFRIKPKQEKDGENDMPDVYYDIYIFVADLTDLNTDGLVNAANPNLHPGYIGDGIARRIREKAGKQMQDACKRIIRSERNNEDIHEGEVVLTKASGKLKSKYVLHAVAPTWTKHILNSSVQYSEGSSPTSSLSSIASSLTSSPTSSTSSASACIGEKFEYLMEKTFANVLRQAHDPKIQLGSLAFPVSNTSLGGAFDLPVELCAHSLYTQLSDFKVGMSTSLKTICVTSLEPQTVKTMIDIFANYIDNYLESSWAVPLSPVTRLVNEALRNRTVGKMNTVNEKEYNKTEVEKIDINPNTDYKCAFKDPAKNTDFEELIDREEELTVTNEEVIAEDQYVDVEPCQEAILNNTDIINLKDLNMKLENLKVTIQIKDNTSNAESNGNESNFYSENTSRLISIDGQTLANIKQNRQNKPRTISNSSSSYSSESGGFDKSRLNFKTSSRTMSESSGGNLPTANNTASCFKTLDMKSKCDSSCLFCQRENRTQLVTCFNDSCKTVYCRKCILNYYQNQKTQKCPSCRTNVEREHTSNHKERFSSSPEPTKLMSIQNTGPANSGSNNSSSGGSFNFNRLKFNNNTNSSQHQHSNHSSHPSTSGPNSNLSTSNQKSVYNQSQLNSKHAITQAKVYVRIIDEPCDGYEKFKTLMVTFEIEDGVQSDNHPRPGVPYKGTTKKVYLPEIPEHREILAFYEKSLHSGRLFKIAFSRPHDDYRVLLNQDVLLKTIQHGGGRFGYPDHNYVKDLLHMARSSK